MNEVKERMGEFYMQLVTISMSSKMCDHKYKSQDKNQMQNKQNEEKQKIDKQGSP